MADPEYLPFVEDDLFSLDNNQLPPVTGFEMPPQQDEEDASGHAEHVPVAGSHPLNQEPEVIDDEISPEQEEVNISTAESAEDDDDDDDSDDDSGGEWDWGNQFNPNKKRRKMIKDASAYKNVTNWMFKGKRLPTPPTTINADSSKTEVTSFFLNKIVNSDSTEVHKIIAQVSSTNLCLCRLIDLDWKIETNGNRTHRLLGTWNRPEYGAALLVHMISDSKRVKAEEECGKCSKKSLRVVKYFKTCISSESGLLHGACTNCHAKGDGSKCSFREGNAGGKDHGNDRDPVIIEDESDENDWFDSAKRAKKRKAPTTKMSAPKTPEPKDPKGNKSGPAATPSSSRSSLKSISKKDKSGPVVTPSSARSSLKSNPGSGSGYRKNVCWDDQARQMEKQLKKRREEPTAAKSCRLPAPEAQPTPVPRHTARSTLMSAEGRRRARQLDSEQNDEDEDDNVSSTSYIDVIPSGPSKKKLRLSETADDAIRQANNDLSAAAEPEFDRMTVDQLRSFTAQVDRARAVLKRKEEEEAAASAQNPQMPANAYGPSPGQQQPGQFAQIPQMPANAYGPSPGQQQPGQFAQIPQMPANAYGPSPGQQQPGQFQPPYGYQQPYYGYHQPPFGMYPTMPYGYPQPSYGYGPAQGPVTPGPAGSRGASGSPDAPAATALAQQQQPPLGPYPYGMMGFAPGAPGIPGPVAPYFHQQQGPYGQPQPPPAPGAPGTPQFPGPKNQYGGDGTADASDSDMMMSTLRSQDSISDGIYAVSETSVLVSRAESSQELDDVSGTIANDAAADAHVGNLDDFLAEGTPSDSLSEQNEEDSE